MHNNSFALLTLLNRSTHYVHMSRIFQSLVIDAGAASADDETF